MQALQDAEAYLCVHQLRATQMNGVSGLNLIINQPDDYKTKVFNSSKFYYAPAVRKEWLKIKDKKALGNTLATFKNSTCIFL